jgi:tetratricopeptide (TPR) repeat protein
VFSTLGFEYATLGEPERAVELFDECIAQLDAEGGGDPASRLRFSTLLSYALSDMGELERAQDVLEGALDDAEDLTDAYAQIRINWSLARLESMRSRQAPALRYARKALALLEATEDTLHLARAHVLCGSILLLRLSPEQAQSHLDRAEQLLGPRGEASDIASLRTEQAKAAAALGRGAQAVVLAREALEVLGDDDPAERGQALWALAQGLALEADLGGADVSFREAAELLRSTGRWRDVQLAARDWSSMLEKAGREREAAAVRERYADAGAAHAVEH